MNITSLQARVSAPTQQPKQTAPAEAPNQNRPQETFSSRVSDVQSDLLPTAIAVGSGFGLMNLGMSAGSAVGGPLGSVVGGGVGLLVGVVAGQKFGESAVEFYGDLASSVDKKNPERSKAVGLTLAAGVYGFAVGGASAAALMVGGGAVIAGVETLIADRK